MAMSNSFINSGGSRIYFLYSKSVSLVALIVSTWFANFGFFTTPACFLLLPVSEAEAGANSSPLSNITLLDLYPELKDYLLKKALDQIKPIYNNNVNTQNVQDDTYNSYQPQSTWGINEYHQELPPGGSSASSSQMLTGYGQVGSTDRGGWDPENDGSSYNYYKEVLKHWKPLGTPEFYDSWKFKPSAPVSTPSYGWSNNGWTGLFPYWEEEEKETHEVSHELSKDFSCLAGLLGLKTLKTLKFATIFKKLKIIAVFFVAFKLGVLLSPVAIPLLFPIIILVTIVKVVPLILIIVLLLKILKKQVKIKKPFGRILDQTGSLFFEDVEIVTEKVLNSDEECIDKISCGISKKSLEQRSNRGSTLKSKTEIKGTDEAINNIKGKGNSVKIKIKSNAT